MMSKLTEPEVPVVMHDSLVADLRGLGVRPGAVLMLHASVRAVGWIVGGPDVVLRSLLEALTPTGTLMMYVGWEESVWDLAAWSEEKQHAYREACPPFDPATSRAHRKWSILTEYLRTWPGAHRSDHPGASVAAVGARAQWITADHPLQYGYGANSPFARLCEASGQVLLLGSPLDGLTILHHAEHLARVPNKRVVRYEVPLRRNGRRVWVQIEEFDTSNGIVDGEGDGYFELIARDFLLSGRGRTGTVGAATAYLFDAPELTEFGVEWMERRFGKEHD